MNYIYDILINFKPYLYDVYEWNKEDDILHLRKIPLFYFDRKMLCELVSYHVKIDVNFLSKIFNRTELFTRNKIASLDYCFLGTDGEEVVGFMLDKQGQIIKYSKLLLEEEMEVIEYARSLNNYPLHYTVGSKIKYDFKTREERKIKQYIDSEIKKIMQEENYDKLEYIYLDCFGKTKKKEEIMKTIYKDIENNWSCVYLKLYQFLKITNK